MGHRNCLNRNIKRSCNFECVEYTGWFLFLLQLTDSFKKLSRFAAYVKQNSDCIYLKVEVKICFQLMVFVSLDYVNHVSD
jgi:hypothetical protein